MCYKWVSVNLSLLSDFTCGLNLTTSSSVYVYKTPKSEEVRKHSTWPADNVLDFYLDPADNGRVQGSQGRANFQLLLVKWKYIQIRKLFLRKHVRKCSLPVGLIHHKSWNLWPINRFYAKHTITFINSFHSVIFIWPYYYLLDFSSLCTTWFLSFFLDLS